MKPDYWKTETGRPTSAVFKDSKGVSVDRDGGRNDSEVTASFIQRFGDENIRSIVSVTAQYCCEIDTHLVYAPVEGNEYHALIHDSPDKITLRSSKAKKLAENCKVVYKG
ncbi:hypothetical protein [Lentibacillus songyuanensis]|uniref:hypothetical protein n=1 Tax=Lentibacillus songyuanensis TaxID=3136161 RepID=UPI0031BB9143